MLNSIAASAMSCFKPGIQRVATWAACFGLARIHLSASETAARNFSMVSPFFSTHGRMPTLNPRWLLYADKLQKSFLHWCQ
jgi:hypothetical protein